ncbi:MAG: UDP-glucose/GDP-mannose dehydrogenase family protein, partial [Myxococcales bacterium]|nr:UDP-glucose/GDP-mannose dehydrogenase family protein [Myxococcales bacterium]
MRIAVVGTGYVGLAVSAGLAEFGNDVTTIVDPGGDPERLSRGDIDMVEPGLGELLRSNVLAGRLAIGTDLEAAVRAASVVIITTELAPTEDGADLAPLFALADRIGKVIEDYKVIALKSAVPVGTTDRLAVRIGAHGSVPFGVVHNPSFLKEGEALDDFMKPDRVVIGTGDPQAAELMRRLYEPFLRSSDRILVVGTRSAELAKHAASALLASRISFMNEVALVAEEVGADIEDVRAIMGADPRIGAQALFVGPGFGGDHFQRDLAMLLSTARDAGRELGVVEAAWAANERQKKVLLAKLDRALGGLHDRTVTLWGLAYKPHTARIGRGPALDLIDGLLAAGAKVRAHDPKAMPTASA